MSELNIVDIWDRTLKTFNSIRLYWNDELLWDDNADIEDWVAPEYAFKKWKERNPNYKNYMVENINIEIVEFHHGIVKMYGKEVK